VRRILSIPKFALVLAAFACAPAVLAQGYGGTVYDFLVRGDILLTQGKVNEAIVQFQEVRTLCPTPGETVQSLQGEGRARLVQGEFLQAAGLFEEAATRFPDDPRVPDLLYAAGMARIRGGQPAEGADLLQRALDRGPTPDVRPVILFQLSQALRTQGKPAEVIELLKNFEETYPDHHLLPNVLYTLAIAQHDLGNLKTSEELYRKVIDRFKGTPAAIEAHFELAAVFAEEGGHRRQAADFYRTYVSLNPSSPEAGAALERAADLLLLLAPRDSAQLYALAKVKADANPKPALPELGLSRWLPMKRTVADALSRTWVVVLLGLACLGGLFLAGRGLLRWTRRRAAVGT
jgi:tetratricopeptide (TPR) repeat protein